MDANVPVVLVALGHARWQIHYSVHHGIELLILNPGYAGIYRFTGMIIVGVSGLFFRILQPGVRID